MFYQWLEKIGGTFESKDERNKFIRLAVIFAFTIGVYWIINPTKDVVFLHTVGIDYLPFTKIFSMLIMIPLILLYSKISDLFPRHRLFYAVCALYGIGAFIFSYLIMHPTIGLANVTLSSHRLLGWAWYGFVESFGPIMVALFWSFAADTSTPESAKRGFTLIALGAQIGGVSGPLMFHRVAAKWGPGPFAAIGGLGIICIAFLIAHFMRVTPESQLVGFYSEKKTASYKKPSTSFFEGLKLIFSNWYLMGIVGVVTLYEAVATVVEFHMKFQAKAAYPDLHHLNSFFFKYALCANGVALLSILLGVGAIGRKMGIVKTLLLLPLLTCLGVAAVGFKPTLLVTALVMICVKGLNYALNQPTKEQLYIPTSRPTKYKAKAWIDMFGSKTAKSAGSAVHMLRPVVQSNFVGVSSLICFGLLGIWIVIAWLTGVRYMQAVKNDEVVC